MADYKIELGIKLKDNELDSIKGQIKNIEKDKINIQLDTNVAEKQIESLKKELQSLGTANKNKNALAINTESVEKSLNEVHSTINEIKTALGTIDSKSGMKSLLSSINQISTALDKASGQFGELNAELKKLSSKDFGINIDLKFGSGKNPVAANAAYGQKVRNETLPQLKSQLGELTKYLQQYYGVADEYAAISKLFSSTTNNFGKSNVVNTDLISFLNDFGSINTGSLASQMTQYKTIIEQIISMVKYTDNADMNVGINNITAGFSKSADELIGEAKRIQSGLDQAEKQAEETKQQFKGLFGGGIDSDTLNAQLDSIVNNLTEIKSALQSLSANNSIDGLTQSFNGLSQTLEKLIQNAGAFKQAMKAGVSGVSSGVNNVAGVDSDSFVDKEVLNMMKELGVAGGKGSEAFREIKSAMLEYIAVAERAGNETGEVVNELAMLERSNAMSKVRDTALNYGATQSKKKELKEQQKLYKDFYADIRKTNKNGTKIFIPADVQAELPKNITRSLGSAFITKNRAGSMELDSWLKDLSERFPYVVDRTKDLAGQLMDVFQKLEIAKGRFSDASVDGAFSDNEIRNAENVIENAANNIVNSQQRIQDASSASADSTSQSQQKIRQEYEETLEKIKQIDAQIAQRKNKLKEETSIYDSLEDDPNYSKEAIEAAKAPYIEAYESDVAPLKQQRAELLAIAEAYEKQSQSAKETTGVIENLKSTLQSMNVDRSSIDAIIKDVEELGFTVKDASVAMKNGNLDITVTGIDNVGRVITEVRHLDDVVEELPGVSRKISQSLSETDNFVKQQKRSVTDLTNQINELNRKAIDPNTSKPIKDESHLNSLKDKYNEVVAAIKKMGDASSSTFDEERNAVKTLISEYKSLTREYKNAETVATSLRSKDIDTVKATYASKLDVLISKMKDSGVYSAGFEKGAENLRSILSGSVDAKGLVSFLNGLDKLDAGFKRAAQSAKSFEQAQTYGKRASGLESEIKNLQRISPEINEFEAEINGAKVSVQSLLKDLSQVKTKADFNSVNEDLKAFKKAAEASGIAIKEITVKKAQNEAFNKLKTKAQEISKLKIEIAGFDTTKNANEIDVLTSKLNRLESEYNDLYSATAKDLNENQVKELGQIAENTATKVKDLREQLSGKQADTSAIDKQKQAYKELKSIVSEIGRLEVKIAGLDVDKSANEVDVLNRKLKELKAELSKFPDGNLDDFQSELDETKFKISQVEAKLKDINANRAIDIGKKVSPSGDYTQQVAKLERNFNNLTVKTHESEVAINNLKEALMAMQNAANDDDRIAAETRYLKVLKDTEVQLKRNKQANDDANKSSNFELDKQKSLQKLKSLFTNNSEAARKFGSEMQRLEIAIASCGDDSGLKNINKQIDILSANVKQANVQTQSLGERIKTQFQKYSTYFGVAELIMYGEQALRDMFEQVRAIDTAMTELKKVTDETDATYNNFLSNAGDRAKEIGTTIDGLIQSTSQFARLGYGFKDAQGLAEVANIYAVVGDEVEGVEGATTSLISTMTAFKDEMNGLSNTDFSMKIIDVYNELGNKFAISSGGLGEAFQRSASSMAVAGNTLSETASLIVAANTVVQNPEKVGNAFKTISMRLRAAKTQLSEMGEDTEGMAESTASLRAEMLALTGVDLMESPTQFKSTFKFLEELAGKWEHLTDVQRASVIELAAGGGALAGIYRNIYRRIYLIALVA